ncbi:TPA: DUF3265 domain-containing protein [Vibrio vulnificus]|nr:DUF3265 domain-containing protein [Vibrio vulnificus]
MHLTKRLSGIHAAWHFWYAVSFSGERGVLKVGLSGIHPLTQRYAIRGKINESTIPSISISVSNTQWTASLLNRKTK